MAAKLAARLEKEPDNVDGWVMLARTYYALNRHADAARAFDRAIAIIPANADLLADYADSLGAAEGGLRGKSLELIERALKADPTHWKALALAGTAAFNNKDYKGAVTYWERMKATVPPGSPIAGSIDASIAEARELGGLKPGLAAASPPPAMPRRRRRRSLPRKLPRCPARRSAAR
jgi:cytochrome c-type biogenesis protein CcmH